MTSIRKPKIPTGLNEFPISIDRPLTAKAREMAEPAPMRRKRPIGIFFWILGTSFWCFFLPVFVVFVFFLYVPFYLLLVGNLLSVMFTVAFSLLCNGLQSWIYNGQLATKTAGGNPKPCSVTTGSSISLYVLRVCSCWALSPFRCVSSMPNSLDLRTPISSRSEALWPLQNRRIKSFAAFLRKFGDIGGFTTLRYGLSSEETKIQP